MQPFAQDFLDQETSTLAGRFRFALLLVLIASLSAISLEYFGPVYSEVPFYAAAIVSGWLCGRRPTVMVAVISALVIDYHFIPPVNSFAITRAHILDLAFTCGALLLSAWFGDLLRTKEAAIKKMNSALRFEVQMQTAELQYTAEVLRVEIRERQEVEANLRKAQEQFDQMAESVSDVFWILDPQTMGVRYVNHAVERLCEMTMAEFMSDPNGYVNIIHPDDRAWVLDELAHLAENGEFDHEFRIVCPTGTMKWVEVRASIAKDSQGVVRALVGSALDITSRKKIEASLRESEDRYRDLVEHSLDLICTHDLNGRLLSVNDQPARVLGYTCEELVNTPMRDIIAPEQRVLFDLYLDAVKQNGFATGLMIVLTKSGDRRIWEYHNTLRTEGVAEPIVRGIAHDVTERRLAEKALRLSEEKFSKAFRSSPSILAISSLKHGHFISANETFERVLGYAQAEVIGRSSVDLNLWVNSDDRTDIIAALDRGEPVRNREISLRRKDGENISVLFSAELIVIGNDKYFLAVGEDITQRKALEEQLRQSQKMEAIALVSSGVAHDFNNILTGILGFGELLLKSSPPTDRRRQQLKSIVSAALQGRELTRQLLAYTHKQALAQRPLSLAAEINGMAAILRGSVTENIELNFDLRPDPEAVLADTSVIQQLVLNLVVNARDAMPDGGILTIRTHAVLVSANSEQHTGVTPDRYVVLEVSDTGSGMDSITKQHAFEPYFTTKPEGVGTGLGLYRVYGLVRQCSGEIRVTSDVGLGSTFRIYFPAAAGAVADPVVPVASPFAALSEIAGSDISAEPRKSIFVVEDNAGVRGMLHEQLESFGFNVISKGRPLDALETFPALSEPVDLLLTDIVMPDLGGPELARRLRDLQPALKVLFITGYADDDLLTPDMLGADSELLRKPFTTEELVACIERLLVRKASAQTA